MCLIHWSSWLPVTEIAKYCWSEHDAHEEDCYCGSVNAFFVTNQIPLWKMYRMKTWKILSHDLSDTFLKLTSVAKVDLKVVLSYTQPFRHATVGNLVMLEELSSRWYWGSANIWQEFRVPSSWNGILTTSLSCWVKPLNSPPSSRPLALQWCEGIYEMKLLSRKLNGKISRGITIKKNIWNWNLPKPPTSSKTSSNFIVI